MIREAIAALVDGRSLTEAEAAAPHTGVTLSLPAGRQAERRVRLGRILRCAQNDRDGAPG